MKILIAEDDATSRLILQSTFQKAGHEVMVTEDGQQAWKVWKENFCPVVISDWLMPGLNGLELCGEIRKTADVGYTYIILLTAHGGKANYLEAMEAGVDDFITKPADKEQLLARLHVAERILGLRHQVKKLEGLLPICACCKKIRDQENNWKQLESYISQHSEATFSHGYCPECHEKALGEARAFIKKSRRGPPA